MQGENDTNDNQEQVQDVTENTVVNTVVNTIEDNKNAYKNFVNELLTSNDDRLEDMCWMHTESKDDPYEKLPTVDEPMSIREAMFDRITEQPYYLYLHRYNETTFSTLAYSNVITPKSACTDEQLGKINEELQKRKEKREELQNTENNEELDEDGQINVYYGYNMKYYSTYSIDNAEEWLYTKGWMTNGDRNRMGVGEKIVIPIKKRQLIEKGFNPEKIGWKSLKQIEEEEELIRSGAVQECLALEVVETNPFKKFFKKVKAFFQRRKKSDEE